VTADSLTLFDAGAPISPFDNTPSGLSIVQKVTNPLPATLGQDPETPDEIRQMAPEAFRSLTFRAVRPEDYAEAAERLPWVQRAGAAARWTGSWLTIFTTPDPRDAVTVSREQRQALNRQLDRFRQTGREAYAGDPRYANLDLKITVCVEPFAYRGDVKQAVLEALLGRPGQTGSTGFFDPDNFTFGTPLNRASLEAAIQSVEGVKAVMGSVIRRRGWFDWRPFDEMIYEIAGNEVIRLENDPLHPDRGSLRLKMEGGA
jgi:predicted phage baseplate assembly protein